MHQKKLSPCHMGIISGPPTEAMQFAGSVYIYIYIYLNELVR